MKNASNRGAILILGGTGFIGARLTQYFLERDWIVFIPTRCANIEDTKNKLLSHSFSKQLLESKLSNKCLFFILNCDLSGNHDMTMLLNSVDTIYLEKVNILINCVAVTAGNLQDIYKVNLGTMASIIEFIRYVKSRNKNVIICHIGSIAELSIDYPLAPYEESKKKAWNMLLATNLIDIHCLPWYVKGRGEISMTTVAPNLWKLHRWSRKWLYGHTVHIVDVDSLARMIGWLVGSENDSVINQISIKPLTIYPTNGVLNFGTMVELMLKTSNKKDIPSFFKGRIEDIFLKIYGIITPMIFPKNQYLRRLANFAKQSYESKYGYHDKFYTLNEIYEIQKQPGYLIIENAPLLGLINHAKKSMWLTEQYTEEELRATITQSILSL